jgi:hypothetical protein
MELVSGIFAGVAAVAGGGLWWWRTRVSKELAVMQATETSTAADIAGKGAGTLVELKGALRCQAPLTSEFAQQACIYYRAMTEREYEEVTRDSEGRTKTERRYQTMQDNTRHAPCVLEDATGAVSLSFEGATVEAVEVVKRYEAGSGVGLIGSLLNVSGSTLGYRYTEWLLAPDATAYVLGTVQADGSIGAAKKNPFVISHKSEEQRVKDLGSTQFWLLLWAIVCAVLAAGLFGWSLKAG